jgi:hypothetical protein
MKYTKINNGNYKFEGIDTWTNKKIEGNIINQNIDVEVSKSWQVVFGLDTENINRAFFGKSLTECKNWLK